MIKRIVVLTLAVAVAVACKPGESTGPSGPVEAVALDFCDLRPNWMAVQNEGDVWKQIAIPATGPVTFDATEKVSIAMTVNVLGSITIIANLTRDEVDGQLFNVLGCEGFGGNRELTGTLSGLSAGEIGNVNAGFSSYGVFNNGEVWSLTDLANTPQDLVALRLSDTEDEVSRVIVRRNVTPQVTPSTPIALNFEAPEAVAPEVTAATVIGSDELIDVENTFRTASGTAATLNFTSLVGGGSFDLYSVPPSLRIATDVHELDLITDDATGGSRELITWYNAPSSATLAFGPLGSVPTVTQVATSPVLRVRAVASSQADYPSAAAAIFSQADEQTFDFRFVLIFTSAGFIGSTPGAWELTIPDLSGAAYQAAWGLTTALDLTWEWTVFNSGTVTLFAPNPVAGSTVKTATNISPVLTKVARFGHPKRPPLRVFGTPLLRRQR